MCISVYGRPQTLNRTLGFIWCCGRGCLQSLVSIPTMSIKLTSELTPLVIIFILSWGCGSDLVSLSLQSMPVISNVGKNLRQVFPTFKNRSIGVSGLSVSLVCRSIVTCIVSRCCRTACVAGEFGRRTEVQVLSCLVVFGVCNLWILFQPMHEPDIWHDLVGD